MIATGTVWAWIMILIVTTTTMTRTRTPLTVRAFGKTCSFVAKTRSRNGSRKAITTTRTNDIVRGRSTTHTIRSRNTPTLWLGSRQDDDNDNSSSSSNYNSTYDSSYQEEKGFGGNPRGASSNSLVKEVVESVLTTAGEAAENPSSPSSSESTARTSDNDVAADVSASSPFQQLFRSTLQRAYSTTAIVNNYKNNNNNEEEFVNNSSVDDTEKTDKNTNIFVLNATKNNKYANTTETKKQRQQSYPHHAKNNNNKNTRYAFPFATAYKNHPALNHVALAHALWASVVRPNVDSIIDATCGNGNDSIVLAEILFGQHNDNGDNNDDCDNNDNHAAAELLCVDVQARACAKTTEALREVLPESIRIVAGEDNYDDDDNHELEDSTNNSNKVVRVLQASHERLPRPTDTSSVGLIVYNLGWLPGNTNTNPDNSNNNNNDNGKDCVTTMETTLASLVDAISLLRVGGMLSVVTYPLTSRDEDAAVRLFLTCLALRSSRTRTWEEKVASFVAAGDGFGDDNDDGDGDGGENSSSIDRTIIAHQVTFAMETIVERGLQTWRVSQNDKLGMESPPVLFTATRIK